MDTDAWEAWFTLWCVQWRACLARVESILDGHGCVPWDIP